MSEFILHITSTLTVVTFFPLVGVCVLLLINKERKDQLRWVGVGTALLTFVFSLVMLGQFDSQDAGMQLVVSETWIQIGSNWNIDYHLGVDGLSVLLVLLGTLLTPIAMFASWTAIEERVKEYMIFFLLLEVGMTGVFLALDLFLFYIFWEFTLVPMYFLIGIWGGENRIYASIKFFLYTMAGSILMLVAVLWIGTVQGTFSYTALASMGNIPLGTQRWLFLAFAAAFAIKVPMWPLHSWLQDAHVEAPTALSLIHI